MPWLRLLFGALRGIPLWVWLLLAAALVFRLGVSWHQGKERAVWQSGYDAGYAKAGDDQRKAQAAANARAERINSTIRKQSDEEARHISRAADALGVRGPGKATCPRAAAPSGGASGHEPAARPADAAVDPVPDGGGPELIALPFADAIGFARQCDLNRNEAAAWRESDQKQREAAQQEAH